MIKENTTRNNVKLVNSRTGEMNCLICGYAWLTNKVLHGRFKKGSWKCPKGCNE
ncbi:MAG: hypothetical protein PHN22_04885 [Candidatus ainarchaeum sp.]|nr:hypothetical protein [Candidatus ainarchaeum sp.]